jgi:hypothetical protein
MALAQHLQVLDTLAVAKFVLKFPNLPSQARAIIVVVLILIWTIVLVSVAVFTSHAYLPFILLGISYGIILSYPILKLFGAKIQAALAGLLSGISVANLGAKEALARSWIQSAAKGISGLVTFGHSVIAGPQGSPVAWTYMDSAVVYCLWMAVLTLILVVAANAYFSAD